MKTPYEKMTGKVPNISHLIKWFCPGVYHVAKESREKGSFAFRARLCRFLGFDTQSKGCIVLDWLSRSILVRYDCVFDVEVVNKFYDDENQDYFISTEKQFELLNQEVTMIEDEMDPDIPEELSNNHPGDVSPMVINRQQPFVDKDPIQMPTKRLKSDNKNLS
jgi:hypothetical protein